MLGAELPEAVRNRLLRRADWRFLLREPTPGRTLCLAGGMLREAAATISGSVVTDVRGAGSDCDLAIGVNPDRFTLEAAWACLRPGGACYTEWRWVPGHGIRRIRRALEQAGFADVECYWAWPSVERCHAWLPAGARGALSGYFGRDGRRPPRIVGRLRRLLRRAVAWPARSLGLPLPVRAVAYRPAADGGQNALETGIADWVRAGWRSWEQAPPPVRLSCLLLTTGPRAISKAVGLVFAEPDPRPRIAVKIARVPDAAAGLAREAAALRALGAVRPGGLPGVPRLLFCRDFGGLPAVGETALDGVPLLSQVTRSSYRDLAWKATTWIAELGRATLGHPQDAGLPPFVQDALDEFEANFGPILDPAMVRTSREMLTELSLPSVCEHRDYSPWNVFVAADGQLAVLDWESAELHGLPVLDLIYFLTYLAFSLDNAPKSGRIEASYRAGLTPSTFTGGVQQECLAHYAERLGIDSKVVGRLRVLAWILHSRSEYRHYVADTVGTPTTAALRRSLFVRLWELEVRHGR